MNEGSKRDHRQEVTDEIVRLLEQGTAPWQKPWEAQDSPALPYNPTTDKPYRGGNVLSLMVSAVRKGFTDPRWATYRQASAEGWQVRRGEKGTPIEFWEPRAGDKETGEDRKRDQEPERSALIHRVYTVFNAQQMDGPPPIQRQRPTSFEVVEAGEKILKDSGSKIFHDQADRAFYHRGWDTIHLPPRQAFPTAEAYYGTSIHELVHWTGHSTRLNRDTLNKSRGFGAADEHYSREELVAEIGSMMLAAEKGIPHHPEQHAAYVGSWIRALQNDKNEIFRAASAASAATDYVLSRDRQQSLSKPDSLPEPALLTQQSTTQHRARGR